MPPYDSMRSDTLGLGAEPQTLADDELRAQYRAYRRRQARALVRLLPRDAIRPLYRRAMAAGSVDPHADPLGTLLACCESLLPLPPFEVWHADRALHPEAHVADLDDSAEAPTADAPTTVETRALDIEGRPWSAQVVSRRCRVAGLHRVRGRSLASRAPHRGDLPGVGRCGRAGALPELRARDPRSIPAVGSALTRFL
jgi:hypothetical protein